MGPDGKKYIEVLSYRESELRWLIRLLCGAITIIIIITRRGSGVAVAGAASLQVA